MRTALLLLAGLAPGILGAGPAAAADWPTRPDPALTPGVVRTDLTQDQICRTKWGKDARAVTAAMKAQVFRQYHVPAAALHVSVAGRRRPAFEVDHLISRELGGADDVKNLWPQPYFGAWNAHLKDRLENRLHVEVCAGRLSLAAAQQAIRSDWQGAYSRYFGKP